MQDRKHLIELSPVHWVIILAAVAVFAMHMYIAPGYGFFFDELYTIALSKHLAFGYVDLPPLVPALVALSRALLGESLLAMHVVPALASVATLIFVCLIAKEFGGKSFAVALSALGFIFVPLWLSLDSIFCYDSIDQLVLAGFLYALVRFLGSGNRRLWVLLGFIAGIACMTKMTILFLGPGFLVALLISRYRKDLMTLWPWLGAALCLALVSPYLIWQIANHWPTLEYWNNYGTLRVYQASIPQYFMNILVYMNPFLLPLWAAGLYRIFRRLNGVNYSFLGVLFLLTLALMFYFHASARMLGELFIPLIAASAVFVEEMLTGARWKRWVRAVPAVYLLVAGALVLPSSLPILPIDTFYTVSGSAKFWYQSIREFNTGSSYAPVLLVGRLGWDEFVQDVAGVYNQLPAEDRSVVGIYTDWYGTAGAIDLLGPKYGLPHAVSGSLTYYLWGPGYSWDVMIIVTGRTNPLSVFFDECTQKTATEHEYDMPTGNLYIFVCEKPKIPADVIWRSLKRYR
jgi:4-amino-4-deoxy-L-arabinose transferase-like glycosyltransferase